MPRSSIYTYTADKIVCPHCEKDQQDIYNLLPKEKRVISCIYCNRNYVVYIRSYTTTTELET